MKKIFLVGLLVSGCIDGSQTNVALMSKTSGDIDKALRDSLAEDIGVRVASLQALYSHALGGRIVFGHFGRLLDIALQGLKVVQDARIFNSSYYLLQWLIEHGAINDDNVVHVVDVLIEGLLESKNDNVRWSCNILLSVLFKQKSLRDDEQIINDLIEIALSGFNTPDNRGALLLWDLIISQGLVSQIQFDMICAVLFNRITSGSNDVRIKSLQNLKSLVEQSSLSLDPKVIQHVIDIAKSGREDEHELVRIVSSQLYQSIMLRSEREGFVVADEAN